MYLFCATTTQLTESFSDLTNSNIIAYPLAVMEFIQYPKQIELLKQQINDYDYVLVTSPTVIESCAAALAKATVPRFMTVGNASAQRLAKFTNQEIINPTSAAGIEALFEERVKHMNLARATILNVTTAEDKLENQTELQLFSTLFNLQLHYIAVCKRNKAKLELAKLKNLLLMSSWRGIIVTSRLIVQWLFEQANTEGYVELLTKQTFITLHKHIADTLKRYKVKHIVVANPNMPALIAAVEHYDKNLNLNAKMELNNG